MQFNITFLLLLGCFASALDCKLQSGSSLQTTKDQYVMPTWMLHEIHQYYGSMADSAELQETLRRNSVPWKDYLCITNRDLNLDACLGATRYRPLSMKPAVVDCNKRKDKRIRLPLLMEENEIWAMSFTEFEIDDEFAQARGSNVFQATSYGNILVYRRTKDKTRHFFRFFEPELQSVIAEFHSLFNFQNIPSILQFEGFVHYHHSFYFVNEYVEHSFLSFDWKMLAENQEIAEEMIASVLQVYEEMNNRGFSVGSLKPELMFITSDFKLKIMPYQNMLLERNCNAESLSLESFFMPDDVSKECDGKAHASDVYFFAAFLLYFLTVANLNWATLKYWYFIEYASQLSCGDRPTLQSFSIDSTNHIEIFFPCPKNQSKLVYWLHDGEMQPMHTFYNPVGLLHIVLEEEICPTTVLLDSYSNYSLHECIFTTELPFRKYFESKLPTVPKGLPRCCSDISGPYFPDFCNRAHSISFSTDFENSQLTEPVTDIFILPQDVYDAQPLMLLKLTERRAFKFTRYANTNYPLFICGTFSNRVCIPMLKTGELEFSISVVAFSHLPYDVYFYSHQVLEQHQQTLISDIESIGSLNIPSQPRYHSKSVMSDMEHYEEAIRHFTIRNNSTNRQ